MKTIKNTWTNYVHRIDDKVADYTRRRQLVIWIVSMTLAVISVGMICVLWYFGIFKIIPRITWTVIELLFAIRLSVFTYYASERCVCNFCKDAQNWQDYED